MPDPDSLLPPTSDPEQIGPFRILGRLGAGGMGIVYEAEQDRPRRRVALKVMRAAFASPAGRRRFDFETEVLARLNHPGIASVFETGTIGRGDDARPWFAMELVRGVSLTRHASLQHLGTRERLELFAGVCDAVHHAHQNGVIHRDLKPGNILVRHQAGPGESRIKVVDFGIARATDARAGTLATVQGQIVGTIEYMSPEQVAGDPDRVDLRTDVYALGVVLFELLSGQLPHDFSSVSVFGGVKIKCDTPPRRLRDAAPNCSGELDLIVSKSLEVDLDRRYASASELAADCRRFLDNLPIHARPPSAAYQIRKFSRRTPGIVAAGVSSVAILIAALVAVTLAMQSAIRQRDEADRRARIARETEELLAEVLFSFDPFVNEAPARRMREVADRAAEELEHRFADDPLAKASVHSMLARLYLDLAALGPAAHQGRSALAIERRYGNDPERLRSALDTLAKIEIDRDDQPSAEALLQELLGMLDPDRDTLAWAEAMNDLGSVRYRLDDPEGAERIFRRALDRLETDHPADEITLDVLASLAQTRTRLGRLDEALILHERAAAAYAERLGPEHPSTLIARNNLALAHSQSDRHAQAIPIFREVLAIRQRTLGDDHTDTLVSCLTLARALLRDDRTDEVGSLATRAHEGFTAVLSPQHRYTRLAAGVLRDLAEREGRADDAARWRELAEPPG
ncbi:MAG: protein kinase [Phycisphaerales bacterium JB037]